MALPLILPYGVVSIYGVGFPTSIDGMVQPEGQMYGRISAVSQHEIYNGVVGETVFFKDAEIISRIVYTPDNTPYTLIFDSKIIGTVLILP